MNRIRSQIKFGWRLFVNRTVSIRMFTLLLLLGFVYHIFLTPLNSFVKSVNHPICPLIFPFLLSDIYFLILFMAAVVYYFSDAPFMKNWTMYQVIRTGRVRWALGQIETILISSFTFILLGCRDDRNPAFTKCYFDGRVGKGSLYVIYDRSFRGV